MKTIVLALFSLTLLAPLAASAKPYHLTSVRWIVETRNNMDVDDRYVTLLGHVTRRIGGQEYWFTDNTGQVRLDSENFDLPIGRTIVVGGRIDQAYLGIGHLEVDVRNWHYYAPIHHTAPVVVVRPVTHVGTTVITTKTVVAPAPVTIPAPSPAMTPPPAPVTTTPTLAPPTETAPVPATDTNTSGPIKQ